TKDVPALVLGAAFAGSDSAHNLRAILRARFGMKCAFPPGQSLNDHPRRFIYQNAHRFFSTLKLCHPQTPVVPQPVANPQTLVILSEAASIRSRIGRVVEGSAFLKPR